MTQPDTSGILPAVQRYVIAWAERTEAMRRASDAQRAVAGAANGAVHELREAGYTAGEKLSVELLDGQRFEVFFDPLGIVVLEAE